MYVVQMSKFIGKRRTYVIWDWCQYDKMNIWYEMKNSIAR